MWLEAYRLLEKKLEDERRTQKKEKYIKKIKIN
jgi:hypothetical protein